MAEWFFDMSTGILSAMHPAIFLAALAGVVIGIIIGIIPGLGPAVAISLAIPLTYYIGSVPAISMMLGIYKGGTYGGSISAILINTPGTPAAAATVLDGYPLALQGKSGKALDMALLASVFGDAFSVVLLCLLAQPLAAVALKFGPAELAALLFFALTIIAALSGKSLIKGLSAAGLGLAACTVGLDPVSAMPRYTFDILSLDDGFQIIPMVIGMFAVAEILQQSEVVARSAGGALLPPASKPEDNYVTWKELKASFSIFSISSLIGASIGALPGTGSTTAAYLSYGITQERSKTPELFGKGSLEGLAAAESGNNAVCGGALIPMLTLGIPGDVVTAILMGALMVHGIHVGPLIFTEHRVFIFSLFGMLFVSIIMLFLAGKVAVRACRHLADMPQAIIMPVVLLLCVIGSYATNFSMSDIWMMLCFGILGYAGNKLGIPLPPFIIAYILGPQLEKSIRQALLLSRGDFSIFLTRPISVFFLLLAAVSLIHIIRRNR